MFLQRADALREDVRQLEHRQSLTHVTVMIFFSTLKVHLYVPEVPVKLCPTVDTVDGMQSGCRVQQQSHLPKVQKYMLCIMDKMHIGSRFGILYLNCISKM